MSQQEVLSEIAELLNEIANDSEISCNIKEKVTNSLNTLNEDMDTSIKASKMMQELELVSENSNLESYTRTQIWNIVSLLERL
ncbi:UPF0147 family protein [Candidatus Woesearchaeota archaeon]|nr:UPF0147 family protein [Candidatus Woesearchaeota archaeon]